MKTEAPELINAGQVATILAIPLSTLYEYAGRRNGSCPPAIRVGKHWRWDCADVLAWLAEQKALAAA